MGFYRISLNIKTSLNEQLKFHKIADAVLLWFFMTVANVSIASYVSHAISMYKS